MQAIEHVRDSLPDVAGDNRRIPSWFGRAGLVGRGLLYVVVGFLAVRIAFGERVAQADHSGALAAVASQPLGRWLVFLLGLLFLAYAIYRFAVAAVAPEDENVGKRIAAVFRGVVYVGLAYSAAAIAAGGTRKSSGESQRDVTLWVLQLPGGRWLVAGAGLAIIAAGVWRCWHAVSGKVAEDLKEDEMPRGVEGTMLVIGTAGSIARGIAFLLVGAFLVRAGIRFDPSSPVGLDESLAKLASEAAGPYALTVVGAGLCAYGLFAIGRSRYQKVMGR